MKKTVKKISSFLLATVMCLGITFFVNVSRTIVADAADDYYAPVTATGGTELLGQIHDLITSTHDKYTTYADCKNPEIVAKTDPGSKSGMVREFYSQADIDASWGAGASGTWNREHVWCQSLSKAPAENKSSQMWGETGGGSDLHHIRPVESSLNTSRNNNQYGEVSDRENKKTYYKDAAKNIVADGGYREGTKIFEPLDEVKGDVARIVLYVYTHYNTYSNVGGTVNGSGQAKFYGTLKFTYIMYASTEKEAIDLLLKWNREDEVDESEITRNEEVFKIQGNRNPFIDHPEYADAIWGGGNTPVNPDTGTSGTPDAAKVAAFHSAVEAIPSGGTLEERFTALNNAVTAYGALNGAEKASAATDIAALRAAIDKYNEEVKAYNGKADSADDTALRSFKR